MSKWILVFLCALTLLLGGCGTESTNVKTDKASGTALNEQTNNKHTQSLFVNNVTGELTVHYLNVGQADSTLLTYSDDDQNLTILIDAGNWDSDQVIKYLHKQNLTTIDLLIGTHPHADHIGQMNRILEDFHVSEVWMSGDETTSQTFERLLDTILESSVDYHEPRAGEFYDFGPLTIEILNPDKLTGDLHEGSISLKVYHGSIAFLFTGDAEQQTERAMIDRGHNLNATFLKLGHHGSNTSTTSDFLNAVNPEITIISAGEDNQYGHPHDEVISRVQQAGVKIYSTIHHGTIIVTSDGEDYKIITKVDEQTLPPSQNELQMTDCVNINEAVEFELETIIHIGTERAKNIIDLRPFNSLKELSQIHGIGPERLADILNENVACLGG